MTDMKHRAVTQLVYRTAEIVHLCRKGEYGHHLFPPHASRYSSYLPGGEPSTGAVNVVRTQGLF